MFLIALVPNQRVPEETFQTLHLWGPDYRTWKCSRNEENERQRTQELQQLQEYRIWNMDNTLLLG